MEVCALQQIQCGQVQGNMLEINNLMYSSMLMGSKLTVTTQEKEPRWYHMKPYLIHSTQGRRKLNTTLY